MKGKTELERRCDGCGAPAAYKLRASHEDLCGDRAYWRGAVQHGELLAAHEALGYAVAKLRDGAHDSHSRSGEAKGGRHGDRTPLARRVHRAKRR
jgi:hypothetical protein